MLGTSIAYPIAFSVKIFEIYNPEAGDYFVANMNPLIIVLNFLATLFSGFVCSVITIYILQMRGVKILLEANSQQELQENLKSHKTINKILISIILTCIVLQSAIQSVPVEKVYDYGQIPYLVYRTISLFILVQMIFQCPFFLNKRVDNILAVKETIPVSHKIMVAWVYIIGFGNVVY